MSFDLVQIDRSPKLLKCHSKSARMGLLASPKALRPTPFRKRKRNCYYTHKLSKLRNIISFISSTTGDPPPTPFNSTTFLMELQQRRELEKSPCQLRFDQYGSMDNLLACWPLPEPPPNNDGCDTVHEDILLHPSSSPRARSSGDYDAMNGHGVIGSSCDSIIRKTHCSSEDVLSSGSIQYLCCGDNSSLHRFTLERQMEGNGTLYCSSADQSDG